MFTQVLRLLPDGNLMAHSMRTPRFRITRWTEERNPDRVRAIELYDHQIDPEEMRNLADDPTYDERRGELLQRLTAGWRRALPASGTE